VIPDDIADGSSLVIGTSSALYAEVLCHRDLHTLDVSAVPKGFLKSIGEADRQHVVYCPLAQVMVNAEDVAFVEGPKQNLVQLLRGRKVMPKGFFDDDSRSPATIRFRQVSHDGFEQNRRDRQIMCGARCVLESLSKRCEGGRVPVVAGNVGRQAEQLFE